MPISLGVDRLLLISESKVCFYEKINYTFELTKQLIFKFMNTKTLLAALVGGVVAFFLGWLVYGMVLESFMKENMNQCMMKAMEDMVWWAMIASNLFWGLSLALLLSWAGVTTFMGGLTKGAIFGLVLMLSFDLQFWSMSSMFNNMNAMVVDVLCGTIMNALVAGVVGWMLGRGNAAAA